MTSVSGWGGEHAEQATTPLRVGDRVKELLTGDRGIIVLDLRNNPFCSEHWKVRILRSGNVKEEHFYNSELVSDSEQ